MAIICTAETNEIWSYILNALKGKGIEGVASSQTVSKNLTLLTTPLTTTEIFDLCSSGEGGEIYVFFSPPSLVVSADSGKSDISKDVIERAKLSEELLDLYYKFKHRIRLINSTFLFDSPNRGLSINGTSLDLGTVSCPLSYKDVLSYLAFNNQIEKALKIEKLLNGVSYLEGTTINSLVSKTCDRLDRETGALKGQIAKNNEEISKLVEELASKSKSLEEAALVYEKKIDVLNDKVISLTGELSDSNDVCGTYQEKNIELAAQIKRLEESLFITQETLENFVIKSDSEIQKINDKFQKLLIKSEENTRKREQAEAQTTLIKRDYEARLKSAKEDKTAEVDKLTSAWKSEIVELEKNAERQVSAKNKELVTLKVTSERVLEKLERENKSLRKELKSYQALYYQVKNDFDAVKGSTTWKTLSPVLKVKDKVLGKNQKFDQDELISNIGLLYTSDLFDAEWYLATYTDVAEQDLDPARHYLLHGFKEGRRPSLNFDGNWYFNYYEDVKAAGFNPLVHFIKYGKAEGRKTSHNLLMNLDR